MAVGNLIFAVLTALVAVNFIFAEENPLELDFDFDYDQVEGRKQDKPPSKKNDTEKNKESTISILFETSSGPVLSSSSNFTQGPIYYLSCTKMDRCRSASKRIAFQCSGTLRYTNKGKSSLSPRS